MEHKISIMRFSKNSTKILIKVLGSNAHEPWCKVPWNNYSIVSSSRCCLDVPRDESFGNIYKIQTLKQYRLIRN